MLIVWVFSNIIKNLMSLDLQTNVIQFTLKNTSYFYEKLIEAKEQDFKIQPSEKWKYCELIPLQNLFIENHCLPIRHMDKKIGVNIFRNNQISQFELGYMSYPVFNHNKLF